jgi:hypothetical protein
METENIEDIDSIADQKEIDEMAALGIVRVKVDYFHYRQFRYTKLGDAIAQAKRDRQSQ